MAFLVPIVATALAVPTIVAAVIVYAGTLAVSFGISYLASKLMAKPEETGPSSVGGTQADIRVDADVPRSIIFGRAATAGSLIHAQTYGVAPGSSTYATIYNTNLIEITALADHPCDALEKVFVEGQQVTLGVAVGDKGQEIQEAGYTAAGGSHDLAVKFFDGNQVTADQWSIDTIGSHPEFPWTSAFIGKGICYARTDSRYNAQRVTARLRWKYVVRGIKLYDPRFDTTVGGSGSQRYTDLSTHVWTENLAVIAYNILRGIYVLNASSQRQFLYGIEGTTAAQLPLSEWFAAMNTCDVLIATEGSLSEAQFRAGGEITVDTEPLSVIKELLKASGGRLVEIGGIYKLYVGAPGSEVLSFSDGHLLQSEGDAFRPVLGLEDRINYITATFTSPDEDWVDKVAPARSNATWELEDGRRLPADLQIPMVQSGFQAQRLMQNMLMRSRQQRKHQVPLSRLAFYVEPGDTVSWTSTRNGYSSKKFEVDNVDYHPNLNVTLALTEIDPADYNWNPATDTLPSVITQPISAPPSPKVITGFSAAPFTHTGTAGATRPGIKISWADPQAGDVTAVLWQIRVAADPSNLTSGRHEEVADLSVVILSGLAPATNYEVRAKFESFEGYPVDWSLWIPVTTPAAGDVSQSDLDEFLQAKINAIGPLSELTAYHSQLILQQHDLLLGVQDGVDASTASSLFRMAVGVTPSDATALLEAQVRSNAGNAYAAAGMQFVTYANLDGTELSRVRLYADQVQIGQPGVTGGDFTSLFEVGDNNGEPTIVLRAEAYQDLGVGKKALGIGAATTLIYRSDPADDISRTYTAWNNGGAGEVAATLTAAFDGDGPVDVFWEAFFVEGNLNVGTDQLILELNGAEVWRTSTHSTGNNVLGTRYFLSYVIPQANIIPGTNVLVIKYLHGTTGGSSSSLTKIQWKVVEHHKAGVQAGGAAAATFAYQTTLTAASSSDQTFAATAIGTASVFRRVVLGIGYRSSGNNVVAVSIGGIAAERIANHRPLDTPIVAQLWMASVPTGTTADIVLATSGSGVLDLAISVVSITTSAETPVSAKTAGSAAGASPIAVNNLEIRDDGVVVAFAYARNRNTFAITWTGANSPTENAEANAGAEGHYASYSFLTTEGTSDDDISFTHVSVTVPQYAAIVAASWR